MRIIYITNTFSEDELKRVFELAYKDKIINNIETLDPIINILEYENVHNFIKQIVKFNEEKIEILIHSEIESLRNLINKDISIDSLVIGSDILSGKEYLSDINRLCRTPLPEHINIYAFDKGDIFSEIYYLAISRWAALELRSISKEMMDTLLTKKIHLHYYEQNKTISFNSERRIKRLIAYNDLVKSNRKERCLV